MVRTLMNQRFNLVVLTDFHVVVTQVEDKLARQILIVWRIGIHISINIRLALVTWVNILHVLQHALHAIHYTLDFLASRVVQIVSIPLDYNMRYLP